MQSNEAKSKNAFYFLVLVLLAGPFYLNDFASIYIKDWRWWLFVDYVAVKLFPLGLAFWLLYSKKMTASDFGLRTQSIPSAMIAFFTVLLIGTVIDQNAYQLIAGLPGYPPLGGMPAITNVAWDWIDLTFGLLMVGICEELVFRGFLYTFISRYTQNLYIIVFISSLAFGLIHWGLGFHSVLITTVIGAVFMIAYIRTRSLPALMLAHFAINFIDFAGIIPKSIFIFM